MSDPKEKISPSELLVPDFKKRAASFMSSYRPTGVRNGDSILVSDVDEMASMLRHALAEGQATFEAERQAKRHFADHLINVVKTGRAIALLQPAAFAGTQAEADKWSAFYTALNAAPVELRVGYPQRCDECDPSFGCFDGSRWCQKK